MQQADDIAVTAVSNLDGYRDSPQTDEVTRILTVRSFELVKSMVADAAFQAEH